MTCLPELRSFNLLLGYFVLDSCLVFLFSLLLLSLNPDWREEQSVDPREESYAVEVDDFLRQVLIPLSTATATSVGDFLSHCAFFVVVLPLLFCYADQWERKVLF